MSNYSFRKPPTLLYYPLNSKQYVFFNYIVPVCFSSIVYILHFTADTVLSYQHYREGDGYHASLTFFWTYVPALGSLFLTVINLELWPDEEYCGKLSWKWFFIRYFQHLLFPVWAMVRYAEQLFWSIEAYRAGDDKEKEKCLNKAERRSVFDLYLFLQAYLQAIPQVLFQMHIIIRHPPDFNKATVDMQVMCIIMSLIRVSMTTTIYQRFYSQKITGREYPWDKVKQKLRKVELKKQKFLLEKDEPDKPKIKKNDSGLSTTSSQFDAEISSRNAAPIRVDSIYGLSDDDIAGKFVAMLWWFCFLIPRILCIPVFAYFYMTEAIIMFVIQYILTIGLLIYFVNLKNITVHKIAFILIISYIYLFCLIEFKIKFTKVKIVYNFYFIFIYLQNIVMMYMWYFHGDEFESFWYSYMLYVVIGTSILSILSMAMYLSTLKPQQVVVKKIYRNSQL